jgi:hypothetical protein
MFTEDSVGSGRLSLVRPMLPGTNLTPRLQALPAVASSDSDAKTAIEMELISILSSPGFRSSPRSCAFLRFVTEETLAGRDESLKERTIGVAVLKRDPAYDTGSDAGVRVRANDVRKRLSAHYEKFPSKAGYRIELPAGSYVPRFVSECLDEPIADARRFLYPMSLAQLSAPTIVALFLALIAIRIQADTGDGFQRFWSGLLTDRNQILVQVDAAADGVSISPTMAEAAIPISAVAASFHLPFHMSAARLSYAQTTGGQTPLQTAGSSALIIRLSTNEYPPSGLTGHSERVGDALISYTPGSRPGLWLTGETTGSLARAVQALATRDRFPDLR